VADLRDPGRREAMPPDPSADQARTAIEAALGQIGFCLPGSITIRRARCGKPRCACAADPTSLHGPYIQWTRTVSGKTVTRTLTRPSTMPTRPGSPAPAGSGPWPPNCRPCPWPKWPGPKAGPRSPPAPGAAPHPPRSRPEPELPQTTRNAGRSARLTREQPSAEHPTWPRPLRTWHATYTVAAYVTGAAR
jgi:hypothetical protein